MTADERWSHLPEHLQALLRELRDKAAARVRAAVGESPAGAITRFVW